MTALVRNSQNSLKLDLRRLRKATEDLLTYLRLPDRDLSILFTDNKGITHFNRKCFGRNTATNVISFSYLNGFQPEVLGDIVISAERAREEAEAAGIPLHDRLVALVVHGLVHVLGFDHEAGPKEARRMRYREKKLLRYISELDASKETIL